MKNCKLILQDGTTYRIVVEQKRIRLRKLPKTEKLKDFLPIKAKKR